MHARRLGARCCRACRTSAPASAPCWRRWSPRCSASRPEDITVRIGDTEFPGRPAVLWQPHDRLDHAAGPHRRVAASCRCCSREAAPRSECRARRILWRATAASSCATIRAAASSFRDAAARLRTDQISAVASRSDDYGGFRRRMGDAALAPTGSRRRAIRRGRGRYRDRHRPRRARGRGPGLRPADEPEADRKPGAGRRADGHLLRAVRGAHARPAHRAHGERQPRAVQAASVRARRRRSRSCCWRTTRATARPMPMASPSPPTSPPRRRSPMRSTMRSACACAPCR